MEQPVEILMVDDSEADVALAMRALRKHHLANRVVVARDGAEALDLLLPDPAGGKEVDRTVPKVILLDLKLPKIDGVEVLRRLKADDRTRAIPVVVMTSSNQGPDVAACYGLGVNSYIIKPVEFEAFARAVADVGLYWLLLNHPPV